MRRFLIVLAVVGGVIVVAVAAALIALQPLARWETRRVLGSLQGMRGTYDSVHVTVRGLSYEIRGLRVEKVGPNGEGHPFFRVDQARAGVYFRELLHGHLVAAVDLSRPHLTLVQSNEPAEKRTPQEAGGVAKHVQAMLPLRVDRLQVKEGEIAWVEAREPEKPVMRLHGVQATLENFATRAALARGEPTVLAGNGTLQSTGRVEFFATADPLAKTLTFAGQGSVRSLALEDVASLIESKTDLSPTKGSIDVFARFEARDGKLTGGVRPLLHDVDVKAGKKGVGPKVKEWLADLGLKIFKNKDTDTVAATIPIEGTVNGPQTQAVPAIMAVLRNAFVRGLEGGLGGLPPPKAEHPESIPEQARRALSPDRGPPRAQPEGGKK
jgi:hypothetical protein